MGQALYRKYRPKKLEEIIGQEHITTTLSNAIKSGSISHAYLLTGPRGVGKTSIARILAHQINEVDYLDNTNHLDIIEIDAASNRRIDEIRDLRDKVNILPSQFKYKVYIIDEVHMLTREAFNALLKTLEEPPAHVIFILATTESHKLPDTIISRTQHFTFKPIDISSLTSHLKTISKAEKISIDDDALQLISEHGEGSFRDSISLLDQLRGNDQKISVDSIEHLLGIAPTSSINQIIKSLEKSSPKEIIEIITKLGDKGIQSAVLSKQLSEILRTNIIEDPNFQNNRYIKLLEDLINVPASIKPDKQLEIVLLNFVIENNLVTIPANTHTEKPVVDSTPTPSIPTPKVAPKPEVTEKKIEQPEPKSKKEITKNNSETKTPASKTESKNTDNSETIVFDETSWPIIVAEIKKKYNTLYGVLRMANVNISDNELTLAFKFPFHKKKIDDNKNKSIITDVIKQKTGEDVNILTVVSAEEVEQKPKKNKNNNTIDNVSDIFGSAEVLES